MVKIKEAYTLKSCIQLWCGSRWRDVVDAPLAGGGAPSYGVWRQREARGGRRARRRGRVAAAAPPRGAAPQPRRRSAAERRAARAQRPPPGAGGVRRAGRRRAASLAYNHPTPLCYHAYTCTRLTGATDTPIQAYINAQIHFGAAMYYDDPTYRTHTLTMITSILLWRMSHLAWLNFSINNTFLVSILRRHSNDSA